MSDDTFDDSLLEDYEVGGSGVYGDEEKRSFLPEPSLTKGLLIAIVLTLLLELGVGLALDVQTNLVHRYLAYMLGLLPIFIAAIYTRSVLKMFFIGAPAIIIVSFALPFFLPDIFSGLMTPFLSLLPVVEAAYGVLERLGQTTDDTQAILELVQSYGIVLDFFFGIFVGLFAAIGLTAIIKLVSGKPGILSIFTFIFGTVFLLLGVILLPYLLVVTTGIAQFGMSFTVGGAILAEGTAISTSANGSIDEANALFAEAEKWFQDAENMLTGLESLGLFGLMSSTNPTIRIIVENGIVLMNAAVDLAQGLSPALAGFGAISRGMNLAMGSLNNSSTTASLILSQDSGFDEGIELVEKGFKNFTQAVPQIQEAITTIQDGVNRDELTNALADQGLNVEETLNLIFTSLPLLDLTLSVFTNDDKTGLLDDPDGLASDELRAPMVHLLLGAKSMNEVQELIGENSSFQGTAPLFRDMNYHLDFTVNALDGTTNPAVGDLQEFVLDETAPQTVIDLKDQITGTINFLRDSGNTTISIGRFGIVASPTLRAMNTTISFLTNASDFTQLPQSDYQNAINYFDGNATINPGIIQNATRMQNRAMNVRNQIDTLEQLSNEEAYGFFNQPAKDFVTQFRTFNLTKNANNFKFIASGFSSMLKAIRELTVVDTTLLQINGNVSLIQTEIQNAQDDIEIPNYPNAVTHINTAQTSVDFIKADIIVANDTLQVGKGHLFNSSTSFNKTVDMPQLEKTGAALGRISVKMENIQVGDDGDPLTDPNGLTGISNRIESMETTIAEVETNALAGNPQGTYDYTGAFNEIDADITGIINEVSFIEGEFAGIQTDLNDVSIDS